MQSFAHQPAVIAFAFFAFAPVAITAQTTVNAVKATLNLNNNNAKGAQGVAVDPVTGYFYVAINGALVGSCSGNTITPTPPAGAANRLSIIDASAAREVAVVETGRTPVWPTVDPIRRVVFVANSGSSSVTIHDAATGRLGGEIVTGGKPHQGGLDLTSRLMVVGNTVRSSEVLAEQNRASIIDTANNRVVKEFETGQAPHGAVVDQERHLGYFTSVGDGLITVLNMLTGEVVMTGVPKAAYGTSFGNNNMLTRQAATRRLFQANSQAGAQGIIAVDEVTLTADGLISFGNRHVWGLTVDEPNRLLLAALPGDNAIGVADLDTLKHVATIPVGACPFAVAVDPDRRVAVASNAGSLTTNSTASIIDMCAVYAATGRSTASCR